MDRVRNIISLNTKYIPFPLKENGFKGNMTALSVTHLMFVFVVSSVWRNGCNPFSEMSIFI
jgi:hypothetical protein